MITINKILKITATLWLIVMTLAVLYIPIKQYQHEYYRNHLGKTVVVKGKTIVIIGYSMDEEVFMLNNDSVMPFKDFEEQKNK